MLSLWIWGHDFNLSFFISDSNTTVTTNTTNTTPNTNNVHITKSDYSNNDNDNCYVDNDNGLSRTARNLVEENMAKRTRHI